MRILYVEDNPDDAELARHSLTRTVPPHAVEIASTLAAAKASLQTPEDFDLVLADLRLPDGTGLELLAHIRERNLPLAVAILTGSGDQDSAAEALKAGADDYIVKRGDYLERLPHHLESVLLHHREEAVRKSRTLRVLYAEHNPFDLDLTRKHLLRYAPHIRLVPARNAEQVLDLLATPKHAAAVCDVLLLDYNLPGFNALDTLKLLRSQRNLSLPAVLVTGQGSEEIAMQAMRLGFDGYLIKQLGYLYQLPVALEGAYYRAELAREHAALKASQQRYMELVTRIPVGVYRLRTAANGAMAVEYASPRTREMLEIAPDAAISGISGVFDKIHPDDFGEFMRCMENSQRAVKPCAWEGRFIVAGKTRWLHLESQPTGQPNGDIVWDGIASDVTKRRQAEENVERLSHYDSLTGLPNRLLFMSLLELALERAARHGEALALLMLDIDHFKDINDSLGHPAGDELLRKVAERVWQRLRGEDTLARLGGDEFVILLERLADPEETAVLASDILASLSQPFLLDSGHRVYVGGSIGISLYPGDAGSATELMRNIDTAMYRAKENGRNRFSFYTGNMNADALARLELEAALRGAIERRELVLHYQAKVDLRHGAIAGAEALLRWRREEHGLVPPLRFIPLAEKSDLIIAIGGWVIDEACRQIREWRDAGLDGIKIAVNVSARQFRAGDMENVVARALSRHGVEAERLELELTESMLMERPEETVLMLQRLKQTGVKLSLDDFGTGYSSLAYLSRFPIDTLKIDQSFVKNVLTEATSATIASSIIGLAHRMNLDVVAEGVETEAQMDYLRTHHCDVMQGYYFSKPVPADDFARLLAEGEVPSGRKPFAARPKG